MVCQRWRVKEGVWQSGVKDDVWKMVCDKVVWQRWCVKDGGWQSGVSKMVCDKVVWQRWCVKDGGWQSGVSKMVCDKVVCESCVWKRGCDKVACERLCVTKLCVKVMCEREGVTKLCERWCVAKLCVWKIVCDKVVWKMVCHKVVGDKVVSERRLCVLPHESQPRPKRRPCAPQLLQKALCTAPATRKPAAAQAAATRATAPPEGSVYCACHTKASRGPSGGHARRSSFRRLCVLHLPHESQPRPKRRPHAPQLLQEALCTAPATRKPAAAQAAATRVAAPPRGSVYCACHTKASRGQAAATRAAAPSGGSVYCACHTKASRGPSGGHARLSSSRRLCVLRLPHESQAQPNRRPRARQLLQKALCSAPATRKPAAQVVWWVVLWCDSVVWLTSGVISSAVMSEVWWVVLWWVRCDE